MLFIHLGNTALIKAKDIVAIVDKDSLNSSSDMEWVLAEIKKSKRNPAFKSIVITKNNIYCSPLSSGTIKKRVMKPMNEELTIHSAGT